MRQTAYQDSGSRRIFVLALDGVPFTLLKIFLKDGLMPNLKQLTGNQNFRPMRSVLPAVSSVAWSTFMTGKSPLNHRIFGFIERNPKTMDVFIPTAAHQHGPTLWEYLSVKKKRVFVMNVPVTYPPRKVNGIMIGGFLGTDITQNTYPAALGTELEKSGYRIDVDTVRAREDLDGFIRELGYTYDQRVKTLWKFYHQESWDFFMAHIMETDRLHHFLWEYWENGESPYAGIFVDLYRKIDDLIGRLADTLPANMELMILSDHGFTTLKKEVFVNKWLYDHGLLKFRGAESPDSLHHIHPDSIAYSLIPGRIYLNVQGRETTGWIRPGLEYEKIRHDIKTSIGQMIDESTGERLVKSVYTPEMLYQEEHRQFNDKAGRWDRDDAYLSFAPDLIIEPEDGYDFKGNLWRRDLTEKGPIVGTHTCDNAFMLVRDRVLTEESFSILDAMPTILDMMQIQIPDYVEGRTVVV